MSPQKIKPSATPATTNNWKLMLTPSIHKNIVKIIEKGNYLPVAADLLGLHQATLYKWMQIGKGEHPEKLAEEPFVSFAKDVEKAKAKAETRLVDKLTEEKDWRAQKFLLEQGPGRERWGPAVPEVSQSTPALAILDILRTRSIAVENGEPVSSLELSKAKETDDAQGRT